MRVLNRKRRQTQQGRHPIRKYESNNAQEQIKPTEIFNRAGGARLPLRLPKAPKHAAQRRNDHDARPLQFSRKNLCPYTPGQSSSATRRRTESFPAQSGASIDTCCDVGSIAPRNFCATKTSLLAKPLGRRDSRIKA